MVSWQKVNRLVLGQLVALMVLSGCAQLPQNAYQQQTVELQFKQDEQPQSDGQLVASYVDVSTGVAQLMGSEKRRYEADQTRYLLDPLSALNNQSVQSVRLTVKNQDGQWRGESPMANGKLVHEVIPMRAVAFKKALKASLLDTKWQLTKIGNQYVSQGQDQQRLFLQLSATSQRVRGFAGCNVFFTSYQMVDSELRFAPSDSQFKPCRQYRNLEQQFIQALKQTVRYQLHGNTMRLLNKSGRVLMEFAAQRFSAN